MKATHSAVQERRWPAAPSLSSPTCPVPWSANRLLAGPGSRHSEAARPRYWLVARPWSLARQSVVRPQCGADSGTDSSSGPAVSSPRHHSSSCSALQLPRPLVTSQGMWPIMAPPPRPRPRHAAPALPPLQSKLQKCGVTTVEAKWTQWTPRPALFRLSRKKSMHRIKDSAPARLGWACADVRGAAADDGRRELPGSGWLSAARRCSGYQLVL